jgi:hypothetical protein
MIGSIKRFNYPAEFVTLPEYSAHRGQRVKVLRELEDGKEYDGPLAGLERMYEVRAADGWVGHAWETELVA